MSDVTDDVSGLAVGLDDRFAWEVRWFERLRRRIHDFWAKQASAEHRP